ncbi:MAG: T9SS type A sorting domain-containing protein [Saprospiraceae bacterium]|nr:T9SS type A sorting domain-containing protein [Saprospiraceae bacterium]
MKTTALILLCAGASLHLAGQTTEMIVSYGIVVEPGDNYTMCINAYYDSEITDPDAQHLNSTVSLLIPNGVNVVGINDKCGSWSLGGVTTTATMDFLCGNGPYTHYQQQVLQNGPCVTGGTAVGVPQQLFTVTLDSACNETTLIRILQGTTTTYPEDECLNNIPALNGNTGSLDNDGNGPNSSNGGQSFIPPQAGEEMSNCPQALPVTFIKFELERRGPTALLGWTAVTNSKTAYFAIERFTNHAFAEIGQVTATRAAATQTYQYVDDSPLTGRSYYRIRQVDLDGTAIYSGVQSITFEANQEILLTPNPARDQAVVYCAACGDTEAEMVLLSSTGQRVVQLTVDATEVTVPLDGLPAGMYIAHLYQQGQIMHTDKLVVLRQ